MFFFFENENNPQVSYLAFETYVIETLQKYVKNQNKSLLIKNDNGLFDAYLPDGIDEIDEPINVEIKYFDTPKKNVYFQSLLNLATKINKAEEGAILLILGTDFTEKSIDSMMNMLNGRTEKKIYIWSLSTFNDKTQGFRDGDFENIKNLNSVLVDAAINNEDTQHQKRERTKGYFGVTKN